MNYPQNGNYGNGGAGYNRKPREPGKGDAKKNMNRKHDRSPHWNLNACCPVCSAQLRGAMWDWPQRQLEDGRVLPESMTIVLNDVNATPQQPGQYSNQPAHAAYPVNPPPAHHNAPGPASYPTPHAAPPPAHPNAGYHPHPAQPPQNVQHAAAGHHPQHAPQAAHPQQHPAQHQPPEHYRRGPAPTPHTPQAPMGGSPAQPAPAPFPYDQQPPFPE